MGGGTLDELPSWAAALVGEAQVARLGLLDDSGAPRVLPVTFAVATGFVWSAVDDKPKRAGEPARVRWLRARPRVALAVDRYAEDWAELAWVQLLGSVSVVEVAEAPEALAALVARYAPYRERAPRGPLLRMSVERALWWRARDGASGSTPRR